jgi:hypothetical protein
MLRIPNQNRNSRIGTDPDPTDPGESVRGPLCAEFLRKCSVGYGTYTVELQYKQIIRLICHKFLLAVIHSFFCEQEST